MVTVIWDVLEREGREMSDLTAEQARALAADASTGPNRQAVEKALGFIKRAAEQGGTYTTYAGEREDVVAAHLTSLGYKVRREKGDPHDPREPLSYLSVTW